jgi:prepilin-type N-terminal cleavage/methylation domain-containing protein
VKKGFTLAETLITMAIIGIIMALSIPAVIQNTNDTQPLFKKAFNTTEEVVSDLVNDSFLYPSGDLSTPAHGAGIATCSDANATAGLCFCQNFFSKLNIIGTATCTATAAPVAPTTSNMDATTTNSMLWYNLHPTNTTPDAVATQGFDASKCDNGTTGITTASPGATCIRLQIDVNGPNKGANITTDQANKDIFTVYITNTGKVSIETAATNVWDESFILQH